MEWITCENTYEESWRRLLEYANIEIALESIISIHKLDPSGDMSNCKKQAEQIRVSLLQAKEYFEALKSSSLFTKPNHLYYGAVSLSVACMLLRGDGTKSLDFLRKTKGNAHHGLDFTFSSNMHQAKKGFKLLESSFVNIASTGHFSNWYSILPKVQLAYGLIERFTASGKATSYERIGSYEICDFSKITGRKHSLLDLIKRLPDMSYELHRYGIQINTARGTHTLRLYDNGNMKESIFTFHSSKSYEDLMSIVGKFYCEHGVNFEVDIEYGKTNGFVKTRTDKVWNYSYPDSRETIDNNTMFFSEKMDTPEIVDVFEISYGLSMLSRYFPDIWVAFLESHCKGAKLVERLISILTTKIPTLILNQMAQRQYIISTHRPFWY